MFRAVTVAVAIAAIVWSGWALQASADDLYRPVNPSRAYASGVTGMVPIQRTLTLGAGALTASTVTTARFIEAVRITCSATCFVAVSASNGASMANYISGGYIPENEERILRSTGGDYVIGISGSGAPTVYIEELSR